MAHISRSVPTTTEKKTKKQNDLLQQRYDARGPRRVFPFYRPNSFLQFLSRLSLQRLIASNQVNFFCSHLKVCVYIQPTLWVGCRAAARSPRSLTGYQLCFDLDRIDLHITIDLGRNSQFSRPYHSTRVDEGRAEIFSR